MTSLDLLLGRDGPAPWLSGLERRLLKFAITTFGAPLSSFLLAGLGEEEIARSWLFSVTFEDDGGVPRRRVIRVEADERPDIDTFLPGRKEPLVLMAFLWVLMRERRSPVTQLSYGREEVLRVLGWDETPELLGVVDETVKRYVNLTYTWTLSAGEQSERKIYKYRGWTRFVTGCGYVDYEDDDGVRKRESSYVSFSEEFIRELTRRSVFEVRWDRVSQVNRTVQLVTSLSTEKRL
jgi:hypothetical protein